MIKVCQWCGAHFEHHPNSKGLYCCHRCACAARSVAALRRHEKAAAEMGLSLKEYARKTKGTNARNVLRVIARARLLLSGPRKRTGQKCYREIQLANRCRKVQSGWRGQVVLGGGKTAGWMKQFEVAEV